MIHFGVLGPLTVSRDGVTVAIGAPLLRTILAALLCRAGSPVSGPELVDILWEGSPPRSARKTTQVYVHRLRQLVGPELPLHSDPAGYRLAVGPVELDSLRFAQLVEQGTAARRQGDDARAAELLRQALQLWRGEPYADVLAGELIAAEVRRLAERRLLAFEERLAVDLDLGRHAELTSELEQLAVAYPYRERLLALRMLSLYRAGRQADALAVFRDTRARLADQLGLEPSPLLQRLHTAILRADEWLAHARIDQLYQPDRPTAAVTGAVPRELPAGVAGFVGRTEALRQLDTLVRDPASRSPGHALISLITGPPGVGKTALAVRWADRVAHAFPDGQLYLDLRGYDPTDAPLEPARAMRRLLDALQVPSAAIPAELDAQAGVYRSHLADRRMLVVLDNARDAQQVRPLLPGSAGCQVIVTSRSQLPGLVASHAAMQVRLAPFTAAEARDLLVQRLGAARVSAEPGAVTEIVTRCAYLPIALTVAAARAATTPELPLETTATKLREADQRLNVLAGADPATDVRAVFAWSYRALSPPAARLFRLLGLASGPEITGPAAASLAGVGLPSAAASLAELADSHLVNEPVPGRYALHDLLRSYAAELSAAVDAESERDDASGRLLDHYLHTAHGAYLLLHPQRDPVNLPPPRPGTTSQRLADHPAAVQWFTAEHAVLLATIFRAGGAGSYIHTLQLATFLWAFLDPRRHLHDQLSLETAMLAATRRMADQPRQIIVHCVLARIYARLGRYDDAYAQADYADKLADQLDDPADRARAGLTRAFVADFQGHPAEALRYAQQAHDGLVAAGLPRARTLQELGNYHFRLAGYRQALSCWEAAAAQHRAAGNRVGEAETWDHLASAHQQLGDFQQATTCYRRAIRAYQQLGRSYELAGTLQRLGELQLVSGSVAAAGQTWHQAWTILKQLDHPETDQLRTRLDQLTRSG